MNKLINKNLITLLIILSGLFALTGFVQAGPNLEVDFFGYNPLFDQANFLPGDSVNRDVGVTNNSGETKKIGLEIINNSSCSVDCLSDVLDLVVSEDGNPLPLYSGSLTTFYESGEKVLSNLGTGETTTYHFSMTFNPDTGDAYQTLEAGFDIKIGFFGEESIGEEVSTDGGGGSGGYFIHGLQIYDEDVLTVGGNNVTVTWMTNLVSTSRVIYSPEGFPHLLEISDPPNYGYIFSTIEDSTKVTFHEVELTGLIPNTTYYWRAVSRASPATISYEGTFTTKSGEGSPLVPPVVVIPGEITQIPSGSVAGPRPTIPAGGEGSVEGDQPVEEEDLTEEPIAEEQPQPEEQPLSLLASLLGALSFGDGGICWLLAFIITILVILYLISRRKKKPRKYYWDLIALIIILIILVFILKCYYLFIPILIIIGYLLYQRFLRKESEG